MDKKPIKYANFESHHRQRNYTVFYFYAKDHADYFEALLLENEIPFERGSGQDMVRRHLIGVHRTYQDRAEMLNDEVGNYYRKPFLGTNRMRNFVLIFTLVAIVFAVIGYLLRHNG